MPTLLNPFWNSQLPPTWVRQVTGLATLLDHDSTKIVTDTNGNVTQRFSAIAPSPTSWGWATITKFSPSGQILWSKDINKDIGLGNTFYVDPNRTYCYANSESVILGSLDGSSTPSQFNKVEYRESNIATAGGTPDHCRTVYGCSPVNDRYIGAPGLYAISSMNLERSFAQYPTLQNYQATSNQNTFAKFGSATTSLPINTSAATPRNIFTPTWTPTNIETTSYDYASSLVVTDNVTQSWSYFSS